MSWDQRIPNEGLLTRQMSSYFPSGYIYTSRPINTRSKDSKGSKGSKGVSVASTVPIRNINTESHLYAIDYYNPNDCMTEVEYKNYIKGQISSNIKFIELMPLYLKDKRWNINTSPY